MRAMGSACGQFRRDDFLYKMSLILLDRFFFYENDIRSVWKFRIKISEGDSGRKISATSSYKFFRKLKVNEDAGREKLFFNIFRVPFFVNICIKIISVSL